MLVLTRKLDEKIVIGDNIEITIIKIRGNQVRIGINAPKDVRVLRGELESHADSQESVQIEASKVPAAPVNRIAQAGRGAHAAVLSGTLDGLTGELKLHGSPLGSFLSAR